MEPIVALTLPAACTDGHLDREQLGAYAESIASDAFFGSGEVPAAVIAFGERSTTMFAPGADMPWHAFTDEVLDRCTARLDVYALATLRPCRDGMVLLTTHFEDGLGTIDHGIVIPELREYTHVPPPELN